MDLEAVDASLGPDRSLLVVMPDSVYRVEIDSILAGGDPRTGPPRNDSRTDLGTKMLPTDSDDGSWESFGKNPVGAIGRAGAYGGCLSWAVFHLNPPPVSPPGPGDRGWCAAGLVGRHHDDNDVQVERIAFMKDRIESLTGDLGLTEFHKVKSMGKIRKGCGSEDKKSLSGQEIFARSSIESTRRAGVRGA